MTVYWREPLWLLLIFYPLFIIAWQYHQQRGKPHYADAALLPWVQIDTPQWHYYLRPLLWWCWWSLLAISLAGPRLAIPSETLAAEQNWLIVVDVSRSMQTTDITPNRLQRARLEIYELLQQPHNSRIAVIVYAARPHILVPFSSDHAAVKFYLQYLDNMVLPTLGSDHQAALAFTLAMIKQDNSAFPSRVFWLTDGDIAPTMQLQLVPLMDAFKAEQVAINIMGIATEDGDAIPLTAGKWVEHQGQIVRSRLNSSLLQQLAQQSQGQYSTVKEDASDWQHLLSNTGVIPSKNSASAQQQWQELYYWSVLAAIVLLFFLVAAPRQWLPIILLLYLPLPQPVYADSVALDKGINAYRQENYAIAVQHFSTAVFKATNDQQRARALHNLGNSYFQQGNYMAAIQVFQDALTYRPDYQVTLKNLQLANTVQTELARRLALANQIDGKENNSSRFESNNNSLDWNQDSTKTWGNSATKPIGNQTTNPLNTLNLQHLVQRGFQHLAASGVKSLGAWEQQQQSLHDARAALQQMDSNPALLFKRLFEVEEGFYSQQQQPQTLPKVLPW